MQARIVVPLGPTVTVDGVKTQVRPVVGDTVAARPTLAANPFKLVITILEVPAVPA